MENKLEQQQLEELRESLEEQLVQSGEQKDHLEEKQTVSQTHGGGPYGAGGPAES